MDRARILRDEEEEDELVVWTLVVFPQYKRKSRGESSFLGVKSDVTICVNCSEGCLV